MASASVHAAEIMAIGIPGGFHVWHRNIDRHLFLEPAVTGVAGGGACLLTGVRRWRLP